jgi:hypothetical protein
MAGPGPDRASTSAPRGSEPRATRAWVEVDLWTFLRQLRVARRRVRLRAAGDLRLPAFQGALWHSVVGAALKRLVCTVPPGECAPCPERRHCAYAALFEARAADDDRGPFAPGTRVPGALWFDPGAWKPTTVPAGAPLVVDYAVAGRVELVPLVDEAIAQAAAVGLGRARVTATVESAAARPGSVADAVDGAAGSRGAVPDGLAQGAGAPAAVALELVTPLRLKRGGSYLRALEPAALARDLAFRAAALGHYHQGLPWPAPWRAALEEARAARVATAATRWVESVRYSARQGREIVMGGLLGRARLEAVRPAFAALLAAGAVIHAGKGASVGLGEFRVEDARGNEVAHGSEDDSWIASG